MTSAVFLMHQSSPLHNIGGNAFTSPDQVLREGYDQRQKYDAQAKVNSMVTQYNDLVANYNMIVNNINDIKVAASLKKSTTNDTSNAEKQMLAMRTQQSYLAGQIASLMQQMQAADPTVYIKLYLTPDAYTTKMQTYLQISTAASTPSNSLQKEGFEFQKTNKSLSAAEYDSKLLSAQGHLVFMLWLLFTFIVVMVAYQSMR